MTAAFLSAEQLVQSFKQNKLSTDERIDLALDIISSANGTILPNRDEFLLEWCINQLVRSAKLEDEKSTGAPYLNPKYYELLLRLIPGNMSPYFIKATISRSAFVPVITRMLNYIEADLTNKKSNAVDLSSTLVDLAFKTLVEGAPYMEAISQDWIVKLLLATLSLTELTGGAMKNTMLDLLAFSLSDLIKYFKWTGMYKKVFSTTVDQLLLPLSRCRYLLNSSSEDDPKSKRVTELLDGILDLGLFHPNYVIDYANLISNPTAPFYRKQLFKSLRSHLTENPEPILSLMPVLLRNFMQKFSKDVRLKIGFGFSWELADIVSETLGAKSERKSAKHSNKNAQVLAIQTVSAILEAIHQHNLYVPSNDQTSQAQLIKLGKAYALLKSLWGGGVQKTPLLCGFCALVSIDYCLVDSDVCWLWDQVASLKADDLPSASSLGLALLQQYGSARQLERCFHAMVTALDKVTNFKQTILCHESFVIGFRCILEQLGSASQAQAAAWVSH
ncbi:hypothetical protein DSO57_1039201 [Entomophthora muscae]|uniref:Uncharacterized protein n=1 Tax=Entomophthora muscae TaxID=34485 RepID=A0ACC2UIE9_9FUNG|nr:hypothetical protein DSO57_1039201 [Entomophthora muscae]